MRRSSRIAACLVAAVMMSGCFGQFALVRKLYNWNASVGDKWTSEVVYLVMGYLLPVYGFATLADAIVINSIEFWTGSNPVSSASLPKTKRFMLGKDSEAVMTRQGDQVLFEEFRNGKSMGALTIQRQDGMAVAVDTQGHPVLRSQMLPDGSIVVSDANGRQTAFFSAEQIQKQVASAVSHSN